MFYEICVLIHISHKHIKLNNMTNTYQTPELTVLEIYPEGILCGSNEIIDENDGFWE